MRLVAAIVDSIALYKSFEFIFDSDFTFAVFIIVFFSS